VISKAITTLAAVGLGVMAAGCTRDPARARAQGQAEKTDEARPHETTTNTRASDGAIRTVDVPGDAEVLVVDGDPGVRRPIVHLHGMCADPRDDLAAWGDVAKEHGTIVALIGDAPCANKPGLTQWTNDAAAIDARIQAALGAVARARGTTFDRAELVVIGESMGAARAERLATTFPDRYTRLVLVGSPQAPSPDNLRGVKAVANLAGENEAQENMKAGTRALDGAGTPARFWELPGATHGEYGPEGARIMGDALGFVGAR
jgi:pimeloyl-ACP methyl ester carboxylesterase